MAPTPKVCPMLGFLVRSSLQYPPATISRQGRLLAMNDSGDHLCIQDLQGAVGVSQDISGRVQSFLFEKRHILK